MAEYLPHSDDERVSWNKNLKENIVVQGPILGLTALETTAVEAVCDSIINTIDECSAAHIAALAATATKKVVIFKGEKEHRTVINRMKKNKNFTTTIGEILQINSDDPIPKPSEIKPVLKVEARSGKVVVGFVKGKLNGMNIYERNAGTATWSKLAYNSYSPYEDKRPLAVAGVPEHREYMGIGVIHDEEVTLQSDIMEAIFGG